MERLNQEISCARNAVEENPMPMVSLNAVFFSHFICSKGPYGPKTIYEVASHIFLITSIYILTGHG